MRNQVKSGDIELESNEESCQAYSEIKDLEFHSRSKMESLQKSFFGSFLRVKFKNPKFQHIHQEVSEISKHKYPSFPRL